MGWEVHRGGTPYRMAQASSRTYKHAPKTALTPSFIKADKPCGGLLKKT